MYQSKLITIPSKVPNQNIDVEESLLASFFVDATTFEKVEDILLPEDFYKSAHRLIYSAFLSLKTKGHKLDAVTVAAELKESGKLDQAGGVAGIAKIMDQAPVALNPEGHARIIKECSVKRQITNIGLKLADQGSSNKPIEDLLSFGRVELDKIQPPKQRVAIMSAADILEKDPQMTPLIEGLINQGEGLIVHAAGGVGKSMWSLYLAVRIAMQQTSFEPDLLFDEFQVKNQMTSLFIQSENSSSAINARLRGMVGTDPDSNKILGNLFFPQIHNDILMTGKTFKDPAFIQHCIDMIHTIEDQTGRTLDLFIVDPLISFHQGDENDASRMRAALDGITEITQRTDVTPIVLHHNNRNGDYRGSSAVYDWARNMISLKRVFIGQDRLIGFHEGEAVKRTAKIPAIEVSHEKANNLPLFEKFTIVMDHNFRFSRVADVISPEIQERCMEVQQALKDLGGFAESNSKLSRAVSELSGRSKRTCSTDIALAVEQEFIKRDKAIKGARGAYSYYINE